MQIYGYQKDADTLINLEEVSLQLNSQPEM